MPKRKLTSCKTQTASSKSQQQDIVWITQGKTQHAAYLIESDTDNEGRHLVTWATTGVTEWVDTNLHPIDYELTPRRRRGAASTTTRDAASKSPSLDHDKRICTPLDPTIGQHDDDDVDDVPKPAADNETVPDSEQSDEEVEFLLVIHPPSPNRPKPKVQESSSPFRDLARHGNEMFNNDDLYSLNQMDEMDETTTTTPNGSHEHRSFSSTTSEHCALTSSLCLIGNDNNEILYKANNKPNDHDATNERDFLLSSQAHVLDQPSIMSDSQTTGYMAVEAEDNGEIKSNESYLDTAIPLSNHQQESKQPSDPNLCFQTPTPINFIRDNPSFMTERQTIVFSAGATSHEMNQADQANESVAISANVSSSSGENSPISFVPYTSRSSVYVQNLAEICHTILWDERWRVGPDHRRLFMWELGDDLSAVVALSQLYDEEPFSSTNADPCCPCVLCRDRKQPEPAMLPSGLNGATHNESTSNIPAVPLIGTGDLKTPSTKKDLLDEEQMIPFCSDSNENDQAPSTTNPITKRPPDKEEYERSMLLYCRLFYRKGPWFRLDDIYQRYYAPKDVLAAPRMEHMDSSDSGDEEGGLIDSPKSIFLRTSDVDMGGSSVKRTNEKGRAESSIDQEVWDKHLARIADLLSDITRLKEIGLIRSFRDEEECGKTIGATRPGRQRTLLLTEERKHILNKLGGGSKKKVDRMKNCELQSMNGTTSIYENEIWKQMSQQLSIIGQLATHPGKKIRILLPVIRHVNDLLLDKWAISVVQACSRAAYLPSSVLKPYLQQVKAKIRQAFSDLDVHRRHDTLKSHKRQPTSLDLCVRLREAPTRSLHRFARLYLCANSGPGSMRGDDKTNGWKSLDPSDWASSESIPLSGIIPPPGLGSWHNVVYPCLNYRFDLASCPFVLAYRPIPSLPDSYDPLLQVFPTRASFLRWEFCVELRAQVDYLIELNETTLYQERRRLRLANKENDDDDANSASFRNVRATNSDQLLAQSSSGTQTGSVDFLRLLTESGRQHVVHMLVSSVSDELECHDVEGDVGNEALYLLAKIESEILGFTSEEEADEHEEQSRDRFRSDCERILAILASIIVHVMLQRHDKAAKSEISLIASRPWLRHLCWEGCLNYMLWDIIPILERRGYYFLAVQAFEVLLFGRLGNTMSLRNLKAEDESGSWNGSIALSLPKPSDLAPFLLSRRARGKAYERLVLDIQHTVRQLTAKEVKRGGGDNDCSNQTATKLSVKQDKHAKNKKFQACLTKFCESIVDQNAGSGLIPFSAIRVLSRRLKKPLATILANHPVVAEVKELGLRLGVQAPSTEKSNVNDKQKYMDWVPPTDTTVANALVHDLNSGRCSYVGFEDNGDERATTRSLNVEELAMEYYATGRLPTSSPSESSLSHPRGGWVGWHDEGGHVRMLFRVLCSCVLGAWTNCCSQETNHVDAEKSTIHLTPYQGAPFDLHVGYSSTTTEQPTSPGLLTNGYYARHRHIIGRFLNKLSILHGQELCDLVHGHISARVERYNNHAISRNKDPQLERDLAHVRTLSMLAAGFGGQQLAAMFRCLFFDYRHYSGGLPDLLLVRALYELPAMTSAARASLDSATLTENNTVIQTNGLDDDNDVTGPDSRNGQLVDLGDWVGEEFHPDSQAERATQQHASMLMDVDDEFLGCSKVGDSGAAVGGRRSNRVAAAPKKPQNNGRAVRHKGKPMLTMPPRLELRHNDRKVVVQCMMVEVKSLNDRLDPRQEDWLNVLDRFGNARVCKFGKRDKSPASLDFKK